MFRSAALLWLFAVLTAVQLTHCTVLHSVLDAPCCRATPSTGQPTSLECDCPHQPEILLRAGDVPHSIKRISISNSGHVFIHPNALFHLTALVDVTIQGAKTVQVQQDGLKLQEKASLTSLQITKVGKLNINEKAMTGFWNHNIRIQIAGVSEVNIRENALRFLSHSLGPTLTLEHIQALNLSEEALRAPISQLTVKKTMMNICQGNSFGRNIHHLNLDYVEINEVKTKCISVSGNLHLRSSLLGKVENHAMYGNMYQVTFENNTIGSAFPNAFLIHASNTLRIVNTQFKELHSNSLSVSANSSIILDNIRIIHLREHALSGLKVLFGKTTDARPIIIRHLSVLEADKSSLAFGECANLQVDNMQIQRPWPQVCPTEKWIRQLLGIGPDASLSQPQNVVYHAIRRHRPCPEDGWKPFPRTRLSSACTTSHGLAVDGMTGEHNPDPSETGALVPENLSTNGKTEHNDRSLQMPTERAKTDQISFMTKLSRLDGAAGPVEEDEVKTEIAPSILEHNDKNGGQIAGVVIGAILLMILVAAVAFYAGRRTKSRGSLLPQEDTKG